MNSSAAQAPPTRLHAEPTHPRSSARIRAAGRETKLAVAGTVMRCTCSRQLPPAAARHLRGRSPRQRSRPAGRAARVRDRVSAPARRASCGDRDPVRAPRDRRRSGGGGLLQPPERGPSGTTTPGSSRLQPACCSSGRRHDPLDGRDEPRARRRYLRRLIAVGSGARRGVRRPVPVRALVRLHALRPRRRTEGRPRRRLRERQLHDQRRLDAQRLVRALERTGPP